MASVPAGGSVAPGRGGDVVGLVLLPTPTTDVLAVVHGLVRATGLSVGAATDAIMEAEATGRAVVLRAHRELAELHAERCRAGGLRVLLERGSASAALGVER
ncbi:MAG: hypothetical protein EA378_09210 [Phycisphaerales bacterium]|nr:MAG: hypothetical protein EA378_09210 [Phycisphaerales bacterium]